MQLDEILQSQRSLNLQVSVENFIQYAAAAADAEQDDDIRVSTTFTMRLLAGWTDGVSSNSSNFLLTAIGVIKPVFALNDK